MTMSSPPPSSPPSCSSSPPISRGRRCSQCTQSSYAPSSKFWLGQCACCIYAYIYIPRHIDIHPDSNPVMKHLISETKAVFNTMRSHLASQPLLLPELLISGLPVLRRLLLRLLLLSAFFFSPPFPSALVLVSTASLPQLPLHPGPYPSPV